MYILAEISPLSRIPHSHRATPAWSGRLFAVEARCCSCSFLQLVERSDWVAWCSAGEARNVCLLSLHAQKLHSPPQSIFFPWQIPAKMDTGHWAFGKKSKHRLVGRISWPIDLDFVNAQRKRRRSAARERCTPATSSIFNPSSLNCSGVPKGNQTRTEEKLNCLPCDNCWDKSLGILVERI